MCGRYDNLIPRDAYSALFRAVRIPRSNFPPRYNVAPTDQIPIVRIDPRDGARELVMARWGLIPFWMSGASGATGLLGLATIIPHLQFGYPRGSQMGPIRAALVGWLSVAADADSDPPREYRPQPRAPLPFSPNSACTAHHAL